MNQKECTQKYLEYVLNNLKSKRDAFNEKINNIENVLNQLEYEEYEGEELVLNDKMIVDIMLSKGGKDISAIHIGGWLNYRHKRIHSYMTRNLNSEECPWELTGRETFTLKNEVRQTDKICALNNN